MEIKKEIMDKVHKWTEANFIPVPQSVVEKLRQVNRDDIYDITLPIIGNRVNICGSKNDYDGEIIEISADRETYKVKLDSIDEVVELEDGDFTVERYSYLPMWDPMWSFTYDYNSDNENSNNSKKLKIFSDCGFRIYTSEDYGYLYGIDGAGYNFYEQHWYPLYMKLTEE